jgi:metallophosphoesterase (TIGR00282 family)
MRLLFVGDIVGKPGRRIVARELTSLVDRHQIDYVVVNVENAAGGFGITPEIFADLDELPIDCYTTGNHIWDKKQGVALLDEETRLLRPANYPTGAPGRGVHVGETAAGIRVATINLEGRVFMKALECPFRTADRLLDELDGRADVVFVDFHAEATSEKQALAFHLDGRVSAVVGTHTHVPTADERILGGGTAFMTDCGMTGPYESVIGMRSDKVVRRFLEHLPHSFEVAKRDVRLAGVLLDVEEKSGKATEIRRIMVRESHA